MSKLAKKPIVVPENVQVILGHQMLKARGPKGELELALHPQVEVELAGQAIRVKMRSLKERRQKALWGTFWKLVYNLVLGVSQGFEKKLEIIGVGYKAAVSSRELVLQLGFAHPVEISIPKGIELTVEKNIITVSGSDKQQVGAFAALVREKRPPEPYKGKGIRYVDEFIRRKAGKVVKTIGGGA